MLRRALALLALVSPLLLVTDAGAIGGVGGPLLAPGGSIANPCTYLGGCLDWHRSDLGVTIGTGVSAWADQSGHSHTLSQATGGTQPGYSTTIHGITALSFSGSQWLTDGTQIDFGGSAAAFAVVLVLTTTSSASSAAGGYDQPLTAMGDATGSRNGSWGVNSGHGASSMYNGTSYVQVTGTATINDGKPHVIISNQFTSAIAQYVDGANDPAGTTSVTSSSPGYDSIGRGFNTGDSFNGNILEEFVVGRTLTTTEIATLESAYFRGRYGTP